MNAMPGTPTAALIGALDDAFAHMDVWKIEPANDQDTVPVDETWLMVTNDDCVEGMIQVEHAQEPVAWVNDYYGALQVALEVSDGLDYEFIESAGQYLTLLSNA